MENGARGFIPFKWIVTVLSAPYSLMARSLGRVLTVMSLAAVATLAAASMFPPIIDLAALDGTNGFAVNGVEEGSGFGQRIVGAGDINGDQRDDLIIGAFYWPDLCGFWIRLGLSRDTRGGCAQWHQRVRDQQY